MHPGNQATIQYQQTVTFIKPLYKQLKQKVVHPEMVAGLYMIVQAIKQRNYLHAYDVYMRLAIGELPHSCIQNLKGPQNTQHEEFQH